MTVSKKTDYALRALVTLAEYRHAGALPARELARRNDVPKPFLEQILLQMKNRGWVNSAAGKKGGYRLALDPQKIRLGDVVRYFDGYLAPIGCVSLDRYTPCSQEPLCRFRRVFLNIRNIVAGIMDETTLAHLISNQPVTAVEYRTVNQVYIDGEGI